MAGKLWQKDYELDSLIEYFTVGEDYILDRRLVTADCVGSMAHAAMLGSIGILSPEEVEALKRELREIILSAEEFTISRSQEDVHTAVENRLTEKLGDTGKKIHTGRSRNDQVIVDLRLYAKGFIQTFRASVLHLVEVLLAFAEKHAGVPMVGRTHMQRAMPSTVGLWAGAFAEQLLDDLKLVDTAYELNDQCPLGSAASYGVPLPLDRRMTAELLGFRAVQNNVLYANNSRGKTESVILHAVYQTLLTLSKLAQDLILFSMPEFGYFVLPDELCSGSSIMPQKKNPCGLELVRAKTAAVAGYASAVAGVIRALPSGYNRDFQETKGAFMRGCDTGYGCVEVCSLSVSRLAVDEKACRAAFTPEVFAADKAVELVGGGVPFRDAYRTVALSLETLSGEDPEENIARKSYPGAPGNLNLGPARERVERFAAAWKEEDERFHAALRNLTGLTDVRVYRPPFGT